MAETSFINDAAKVTLSNGQEVTLAKMSLHMILETTKIVRDLIELVKAEQPELLNNLFDKASGKANSDFVADLVNSLPTLLASLAPVVIEKLVELAALYSSTDKKDALANWGMDDLIKVLTPFFVYILQQANSLMTKVNQ